MNQSIKDIRYILRSKKQNDFEARKIGTPSSTMIWRVVDYHHLKRKFVVRTAVVLEFATSRMFAG